MNEDKKKLVDELLYDKECDVREQLEWIEHQRGHNPDEALKWLAREHGEQKLEIITSWREAGETVALAVKLVNRVKAAMIGRGGGSDLRSTGATRTSRATSSFKCARA